MIEPQHDELHRPDGHVGLLPPFAVRQAGGCKGWVPSPRSDDRGAVVFNRQNLRRLLVIPETPERVGSDSMLVIDPMADIASIVDDAVAAGLAPRRLAFACVYMRFTERDAWERATKSAKASWEVAAYSTLDGHMLRLSRTAHPTSQDLSTLRSDALLFASVSDADWLSVSIEDLQSAPTAWQTLTAPQIQTEIPTQTLPEQRAPMEAD